MMCMTLGGRAAEQAFFGKISTGAADDLNKVTKLAYAINSIYGMGTAIGQLSFQQDPGSEGQFYRPHSEHTARLIDESCMELVAEAYQRTLKLITEQKHLVEKLGDTLLKDEQLGHDELVGVLGQRPFKNDSYINYIKNTTEFADKHGADAAKDNVTVRDDKRAKEWAEKHTETESKESEDKSA